MQTGTYSRMYPGSPAAVRRGDSARKLRAEDDIGGSKAYGNDGKLPINKSKRESQGAYMPMFGSDGSLECDRYRMINGSSQVGVMNPSVRMGDWTTGSERASVMVGEEDYGMMDEGGGGDPSSEGSEDEEDDEDGDIDEDGELEFGDRGRIGSIGDQYLEGQKDYKASQHETGSTDRCQELGESISGSESFKKSSYDRERAAPSLGMYLASSSAAPFLNPFSTSSSVAPMLAHMEVNNRQNGMYMLTGGLPCSYRDGVIKEVGTSRDLHRKEALNSEHESRVGHITPPPVLEAVPVVSVAEPENHYASPSSCLAQKDSVTSLSHQKTGTAMEISLRSSLSDPYTGSLMDDASLLNCGHSFGSDTIQQMVENGQCLLCGAVVNGEDITPNHALRWVVQAFRKEEEIWKLNSFKSTKRRRDGFIEEGRDQASIDLSRARGVQFPYKVNDKVLIKGNKRTPERFVGREAVITTQCLNGWYVVKTLEHGDSVKLQYRSLMKLREQQKPGDVQGNGAGPAWL